MKAIGSFFLSIYKNKRAFTGFIILMMFIIMATIGPELITIEKGSFGNRYKGISREHILGTDYQGRDTFALVVHGSRDVLSIGVLTAIFSMTLGFLIGSLAGFVGGWLDRAIEFLANVFLTLPQIPVLLIISAFVPVSNKLVMALVIAFLSWAQLARMVRSQIMSLKHREFISVYRVMGFSSLHIIVVEMLPNMISYLAIAFIQNMQSAINMSTLLIMLGFAPFSASHWGTLQMTAQNAAAGAFAPKMLLFLFTPMACFALLSTSCVLFASGLDEALNPRLRRQ
jgi:peptide/nickel transport system permease protein